jgi:hypothetical protein
MKVVYATPEIFDWSSELSNWGSISREKQRRDYAIWSHAAKLLNEEDSADRRGDCVNALNRVIDLRIKRLNANYRIDAILGSGKSIDNLEKIGAARRFMLLQINRIRNFFEHADRLPPKKDKLMVLVELVWYFLKATDIQAYVPRTQIQLNRMGMLDVGDDYAVFAYKGRGIRPWDIHLSLLPGRFSFVPIGGWPGFEFPNKECRVLPDQENKLWAWGGRLATDGFESKILAKFFEA